MPTQNPLLFCQACSFKMTREQSVAQPQLHPQTTHHVNLFCCLGVTFGAFTCLCVQQGIPPHKVSTIWTVYTVFVTSQSARAKCVAKDGREVVSHLS
jgi:hypothetical protein